MAVTEKYNDVLILQLMDIEKYFDKEILTDVLEAAHNNNVTGKEYRLLYKLNERHEITVLTPVGESNPEEISEGLSQGTLESGPLSAGSADRGLNIFFSDSPYEIFYGEVSL